MPNFKQFAEQVHARFVEMSQHELFTVEMDRDELFTVYLNAFPVGTNEVFRERTEHDCSCCKQFIRNLGHVVAIVDGIIQTVWDVELDTNYPYNVVTSVLSNYVKNKTIAGLFRTKERQYGQEVNYEQTAQGVLTWHHFHGRVSDKHFFHSPEQAKGEWAGRVQVLRRGLEELAPSAFETVIELIEAKTLYRGEEFLATLKDFQAVQANYRKLDNQQRESFVWVHGGPSRIAGLRNSAIGTLLQDLSTGVELERAVRSFESKVAPTNYKRPTALITPRMIQDAMKTIDQLGLEPSLTRRHATLHDLSVNNVLWVDREVRNQMKDSLTTLLMKTAVMPKLSQQPDREVGIDTFMKEIVPNARELSLYVTNRHLANFVSLTAPQEDNVKPLFKWDNPFAWSYDGNVTDAIKERVKKAGGNTDAHLRISLAWFNTDDLDLHVVDPQGTEIYFLNKRSRYGTLDVDMNAGYGTTREPVENVVFSSNLPDGEYKVFVHQYNRRETADVGFTLEVEHLGKIKQLSYPLAVDRKAAIQAVTLVLYKGKIAHLTHHYAMTGQGISQEKWGIKTEDYVRVSTLMHSPNHWDGEQTGNKHWFFMLEGCRNPDPVRGFSNEFLRAALDKHRKVFEVLANKTLCQPADQQLSGLGFSSTRGDTVKVRARIGSFIHTYNIAF